MLAVDHQRSGSIRKRFLAKLVEEGSRISIGKEGRNFRFGQQRYFLDYMAHAFSWNQARVSACVSL